MTDSIFTKIIKGEVPCHKIYDDSQTMAFLDIHPVQAGHVLVIPKKQIEFVWDLDESTYSSLMESVKKVAQNMRKVLPQPYVSQQIVGVDVPHAHVHLIPFTIASELRVEQNMNQKPDHESLAAMAKILSFK